MKVLFNRSTIAADFFFFSACIITALILTSFGYWMEAYQDALKKKQDELPAISDRIASILIDSIDYTAKYAEFIGQRIAQHNPHDLNYIANTISGKNVTQTHEQNLYTTTFDWVTPDKQLRASSKIGVLPQPFDMSDRDYLARTPLHPWTFQVSAPRIGGLSKQWIIPAGMGISNKNGDFLGTITLGFSISGLVRRIDQMINPADMHYIVLTDNLQTIIDSTSDNSGPSSVTFSTLIGKEGLSGSPAHFLATPLTYRNANFTYYKKVDKSPYIILAGYDTAMANALFHHVVLSRLAEFSGIGMAAIMLLYFMRRRLIEPVMELADNASRISMGQHVFIRGSHVQEIAVLGKYMQKISDYVQNEHRISQELMHKTQQLENSARSLELANAEATAACEAAWKADRAKSDFLANMSHELRTPMNAVIGLTNILLHKEHPPEKQKEYLDVLQTSAHHMMKLIDDLLDIARLESDQTQLEKTSFNLLEVLNDVVSINTIRASQKNLELLLHIHSKPPAFLLGDPGRLRQILINLIGNAVKFTEKGQITLDLDCIANPVTSMWDIKITIADTGIGIQQEKLDGIFDKFTQADNSIRRTYGGTGLGLSISKTLIELMQGTISVESISGKGSRFTINVSLPNAEDIMQYSVDSHDINETAQKNAHILLVEDYKGNILVVTSILEMYGYSYELAKNGNDALIKLSHTHFDLILMDVQMPEMDGLEVTRRIRISESTTDSLPIPIIGMTAHALAGDRQRCIDAGMSDYIAKPFDLQKLLKSIRHFTAEKRTHSLYTIA
jgi:signal transduction histidine kinase/CheY-like chemotaxis protein